jgi:WD40 repeat protein
VTDDAIVVADGPALTAWTLDGQPVGNTTVVDSPIAGLYPIAGALLSAHSNGALARWDGSWTPTVIDPGGITLTSVDIAADGSTATTVDHFGMIRSWNLADGARLVTEARFAVGEATDVAIAIDGTRVGVASSSGRVSVLDSALADEWTFSASDSPALVGDVSFDPASGGLATGLAERLSDSAFDDRVTVWDPTTQAEKFSVGGEGEDVSGCAAFYSRIRYNHDATSMAVTSHDYSVLVLDVATGSLLHEMPGATTVLDIAFSPDDDLLVASYDDGTVNVWLTSDYSVAATYRGAPGGYSAIAVMPDSATMTTIDLTGSIALVDLITGALLRTFDGATFRTPAMSLSADGALLAVPTADAGIGIWSTFSGARVATLSGHAGQVTGVEFAPTGDWLASSSSDGTVRTWSVSRSE